MPFRRLCQSFGATATCSEMIYAHQLLKRKGRESALLRHHPEETNFGVQLAVKKPELAADATRMAADAGARFVDLNCGCPIHEAVKKGMGSRLLQKPNRLNEVLSAMVAATSIPITVKLRIGYSESKINLRQTVAAAVDAGVQAIVVHGRTREQRYSRSADWELLAQVAEECPVPLLGNGDILTPYEASARLEGTSLAGAMIARGALIKPWIFRELTQGQEWLPNEQEFRTILERFASYLKDHFGRDDLGRRRGVPFLAWHLDWFGRYCPLPEAQWREPAQQHPLMQTRSLPEPLVVLPGRDDPEGRERVANELWDEVE